MLNFISSTIRSIYLELGAGGEMKKLFYLTIIITSVLTSIGFAACDDPTACGEAEDGTCQFLDCAEVCGGNATEDACGVCNGDGLVFGDTGCCEVDVDECGVCNGYGADQACGCYPMPAGDCDCLGNTDAGCGCGEPAPNECNWCPVDGGDAQS